jgi:hypothetical protein
MRRLRQLAHLTNLLRLSPRLGQDTLPISQLRLAPGRPHQTAGTLLLKPPKLPNRHSPIIRQHPRILWNLRQCPQIDDLRNMRLSLLLQPHHTIPQYLFIPLDFLLLFLFVLAVDPIPFQRILGRIVFGPPVRNISSYEGLPELRVLAADLGGAELDLVELFGGVNTLEDGANSPVLEGANICQACGGIS